MRKIKAVIFDMDGLLLSTEPIYTEVTKAVVSQFGKSFDWALKSKMIGRGRIESAQILIDGLSLPLTPDGLYELQKPLMEKAFLLAQPMPGAFALTSALVVQTVPIALATSSNQHLYQIKTHQHQVWFSQFSAIVTGDDPLVAHCKPAPDIFLEAARRLRIAPEFCLVFEDAPTGIAAAKAAGMAAVAVPDPHMDLAEYQDADLILGSLEYFDPKPWGLPSLAR
ncbi:MAG: HAD family hydrolase [Candidatus Lambdaproteobacteria bacterium RIFOXYD2_FULL_50_16]|uniref:HAD family hydrolase n=1 Tax=Candidatus Lambdaproteobacteria bacterium RIFOXYD2_FULL_50_16 TaxID=1817772 RepID=A0A1F6GE91_9PROT|nr:MAG: HAD family hydrolase [Candidatus Lambdaproteobacteria bacterium RIFOXYD2_FULL_50_16]